MFIVQSLCIFIALVTILIVLFLKFAPTFGGKPDIESVRRIKNSPNFDGKKFNNLVLTDAATIKVNNITERSDAIDSESLFKTFFFPDKNKNPKNIKTIPLDIAKTGLSNGEFVWLGHSTVLFKTMGKTIITDPVFHAASPLALIIRQFNMTHRPTTQDLPQIDIVLISHDHYDHLDYKAIKQIKNKVGHFYVPLGVKAHLLRWGVQNNKVSEYDWYEDEKITTEHGNLQLVFAPTRHFSGRGINNHRETLWGSWIVKSSELSVYFSGDGGYSPEFAKIGKIYGEFDIAFIEDGAYNVRWQDVHMLPEQSAQAGIDLQAKVVLPIHWGKFDLSTHEWRDPVRRIKAAMRQHNDKIKSDKHVKITTPRIGQIFTMKYLPMEEWWELEND